MRALLLVVITMVVAGCAGSTCNSSSCSGCCDATGTCREGFEATACGTSGNACVACATGRVCTLFRECSDGALCKPTNCAGCCDGDSCVSGINNTKCGANGAACVDCTASSKTCSSSTCQ